jgi:DNA-directed RNA polymerase subunit F
MANTDMKLPIFKGTGLEDPDQHWFLCEAVWSVRQIHDDVVKREQLITTLKDRALHWFMKYSQTQPKTLTEIKAALVAEFKKPKSESQCITELKEIKQRPTEMV